MKIKLFALSVVVVTVCFMNLGPLVADQKKQATDKAVRKRSNYVTSSKIWKCPKCDKLLEKGGLGKVWDPGEAIWTVEGTATCGGCFSRYDQKDVYGGRYDAEEQAEIQINRNYKGTVSVVVFKLYSTTQPSNPKGICLDLLRKIYPKAHLDSFYVIGFQGSLTANTGLSLYKEYVHEKTLPDLGEQFDTYNGKDMSGDDVVVLFFK